jgi:hypothetical protein
MLALDDAALARLAIAASAVPRGQRRRWLRELGDVLDGDHKRQRHARRMRRHRARQAAGQRCYRIVIEDRVMENVIDGLVAYGRLSDAETARREAVGMALVGLVEDFGRRWRDRQRKIR